MQIMPNARTITERQDLVTIFILFNDNLKKFLAYWFDICTKRVFQKKRGSKTNRSLDSRAPVNILPLYRDLYTIVGPDLNRSWLSAGNSLRRGFFCRPIIPFTFRAGAPSAGAWKSQLNLV